jgi:hypothetical protein
MTMKERLTAAVIGGVLVGLAVATFMRLWGIL